MFKSEFEIFKPYYKWNTFNTLKWMEDEAEELAVLNLIITGIPSILCNLPFELLDKW